MYKVNGRTISDDYIIRVETWAAAKKVVAKLRGLGYSFNASVEKHRCYYIAQSVVFDDGSEPTKKLISWGRQEVEDSNEFDKMQTYEEFMGEQEPEDEVAEVVIKVSISEKEYETLKRKAERLDKFETDLDKHMGPFNEETDEFEEPENEVDLCTIGEFTLNYFDAWR